MKHRTIDAPWDTDEPYVCFDPQAKYKEVKFNDHKGFVAGSFIECCQGILKLKDEFRKAFKDFSSKKSSYYEIKTEKSFISGFFKLGYSISKIVYTNNQNENLIIDFFLTAGRECCYRIDAPQHKCCFKMDAYGDVEILGEAISEGSRCNFVNGKAEGITGILKYNNGVLDRKYVYEKLSESYLSDEKIKEVAYGIWEKNGRVEGQNERNWYDAKWQMESLLEMDSSFFIDIGSIWPDTVRQRTKELVDGIINEVA